MGAALFFTSSNQLAYTWDADALAYLAACGIPNDSTIYYLGTPQQRTGAQISTYLNDMVLSLKAANLWSKFSALYPFLGGTATTHKFNLINPANTDAAFRLSFAGGITHSATGALPNGLNAFADTHLIPSNVLTLNSTHVSFYSRTNSNTGVDDFGVIQNLSNGMRMITREGDGNNHYVDMYSIYQRISSTVADSRGLFLATRQSSTILKSIRNDNLIASNLGINAGALPQVYSLTFFALNNGGAVVNWSNREFAFASVGLGISDADSTNLYSIVQAFQTSLGRQV